MPGTGTLHGGNQCIMSTLKNAVISMSFESILSNRSNLGSAHAPYACQFTITANLDSKYGPSNSIKFEKFPCHLVNL